MLLLAAAAVCMAHYVNPHPHRIRNADDAVATAFEDSISAKIIGRGKDSWELWKAETEAKRDGDVWRLIPNTPGARFKGEGLNMTIDAKTGCIVDWVAVD